MQFIEFPYNARNSGAPSQRTRNPKKNNNLSMSDRPDAAASPAGVEALQTRVRFENGRAWADHGGLRLDSHFQPIFSVAHSRVVGYEALMRASDAQGNAVPPLEVFGRTSDFPATQRVDQLSRTVHVRNFQAMSTSADWLFLTSSSWTAR